MIEVYAEYLFLQNFLMNFIILHITSYFSKHQGSILKILLGAAIGALYSFVFFFPSLHFLLTFLMKFLFSMLIIVITFTPQRFKDFFKFLSIFYLVSFLFGGTAFAVFYFTNFDTILSNGIFYTTNFTLRILFYSIAIAYVLLFICINLIKYKLSKESLLKQIIIEFNDKKKEVNALIDTGNSLADPISKFPVIIVEFKAIEDILPDLIKDLFKSDNFQLELIPESLKNTEWINKFRIIPYSSLGKSNGILIGFKPDNVKVINKGHVIKIDKTIVGICTNKLSKNGDYNALINPDIFI